jgi:hypothetical protein
MASRCNGLPRRSAAVAVGSSPAAAVTVEATLASLEAAEATT